MALSEDPEIESFEERKAALRDQVAVAGVRAVTIFAADKLSDIAGLRRGIDESREAAEARMGASVANMASHYRDSVQMIAAVIVLAAHASTRRRQRTQCQAPVD